MIGAVSKMMRVTQFIKRNKFFDPRLLSFMGGLLVLGFYLGVKTFAADVKPPDPPLNVHIVNLTDTTATVAWDAPANNADIKHYLINDNGPVGNVSASTPLTFQETNLPVQGTHTIDVCSVDGAGNVSACASSPSFITLKDSTPPTVTPNIKAVLNKTDHSVQLTWDAAADKNGIAGYVVYRNNSPLAVDSKTGLTTTGRAYADYAATMNTTAVYKVRSLDNYSNYTDSSGITLNTDISAPTTPGWDTTKTPTVTSNSVTIFWNLSTDTPTKTPPDILTYRIFVNGTKYVDYYANGGPNYLVNGLASAKSYDFQLSSIDKNGNESAKSIVLTKSTLAGNGSDGQAPTIPTGLKTTRSGNTINLSWTASTDNVGVTGYSITRINGNSPATYNTSTNSFVDSAPPLDTDYSYHIAAIDGAGNKSKDSDSLSVFVDTIAPSTPTGVTPDPGLSPTNCAVGSTSCQVKLTWLNSTDTKGVVSYRILRNGAQIGETSLNTYTDATAPANATINYQVFAMDVAGNKSSTSSNATISTADKVDPLNSFQSPVEGAFVNGASLISLNSVDNVAVTKLELYADGVLALTNTSPAQGINSFNWDSSTLTNGVHTITARSYDAAGNATQTSRKLTTSNHETEPPSTPTGLAVKSTSPSQVKLSWTASTDNVGVSGYYIVRNGVMVNIATGTSYFDGGLLPNTKYNYFIYAFDKAGNISGQSATVSATTDVAATTDTIAPSAPLKLTASGVTGEQINLTWAASSDNVGVASYSVLRCKGTPTGACTDPNDFTKFIFVSNTNGTTSYGDSSGLAPNTDYTYYVTASDAKNNNSLPSALIKGTTFVQQAGTGNVTGIVTDINTKLPVTSAYITVPVSGTNKYYAVTARGFYSVKQLAAPRSYSLIVNAPGYNQNSIEPPVSSNSTTQQDVLMTLCHCL